MIPSIYFSVLSKKTVIVMKNIFIKVKVKSETNEEVYLLYVKLNIYSSMVYCNPK